MPKVELQRVVITEHEFLGPNDSIMKEKKETTELKSTRTSGGMVSDAVISHSRAINDQVYKIKQVQGPRAHKAHCSSQDVELANLKEDQVQQFLDDWSAKWKPSLNKPAVHLADIDIVDIWKWLSLKYFHQVVIINYEN